MVYRICRYKATFNYERKGEREREGKLGKEGRKGTRGREPATEGGPISIIVIIHLGLFPANARS